MRGDEFVILDWDSVRVGPAASTTLRCSPRLSGLGGDLGGYDAFARDYAVDLRESLVAQLLGRLRLSAVG
jgi:hypothetical protein